MPRFVVGEPIRTREPLVTVDAGLRPGVHRFQLEVVSADGRVSGPDAVSVTVTERSGPTDSPTEPSNSDRITRRDGPLRPDNPE